MISGSNKYFVKIFLITFVGVIVCCAGIFYLSKDINKKVAEIQKTQDQIAKSLNENTSLAALKADYNKVQKVMPVLNNYLTTKDDVAINFKSDLENLAKNNNINSLTFAFSGEGVLTNEGITRTAFNLNFTSAYDNLVNFLKSIEQSHYTVKFISPVISEENGQFDVTMSGQVFSF